MFDEVNVGDIVGTFTSNYRYKILAKTGRLVAFSQDGVGNKQNYEIFSCWMSDFTLINNNYKVIVPTTWKPLKGEKYYFLNTVNGQAVSTENLDAPDDQLRFATGNSFKNEAGVKQYIERLKTL